MSTYASDTIKVEAAAKINLYLHVVGRRATDITNLIPIAFTDVSDTLTLAPADELSLEIAGTFTCARQPLKRTLSYAPPGRWAKPPV